MDFVDYNLAKKLKEKGFKEECLACYIDDTLYYNYSNKNRVYYKDCYLSHNLMLECSVSDKFIDAPTISQVLKWLRKEKKIHVVCPFYKDEGFYYYVQRIGNSARIVSSFGDSDDCFDDYEQASVTGIEYVLDNLI